MGLDTKYNLTQCIYWVKEVFTGFINIFPKLACEKHGFGIIYLHLSYYKYTELEHSVIFEGFTKSLLFTGVYMNFL